MARVSMVSVLATALAAAFLLVPSSSASAQAVYGSIRGTISDSSGAVLPGVTVTITSTERNTSDVVVTDSTGVYRKERLLPGAYEVRADLQGFKQAVVNSVVVGVDAQSNVDFSLAPGAVSETVQVRATSPLLKTDRADVATAFDSKQITDLPVLDRNFTKFILLTPGTQQQQWGHAASENPQGSTQTVVNGQSFSGTSYQLDGTDNRDPILGIIVINPTLESIGETKITSQNYDAEFGQAVAGVVSVQTKSGGNTVHGSGFEFYQSDRFQARNPFTQAQPNPLTGKFLPDTKKNQFGGSVGGPIARDRIFFFGDYQGRRNTEGGSRLLNVPTEAARGGDLSAYGVNIYDPLTGTPENRQQFSGNVIPPGRLSPQAQAILALIPLPNAPGRDNGTRDNYVASDSETFEENSFNLRMDARLGTSANTFARYSLGKFRRDGPTAFGPGGGRELVSLGGVSDVQNQSLAYGIDYPWSTTLLGDFRFGFFRYNVDVLPFDYGTTPASDAGIPRLNFDQTFTSGLPAGDVDRNGDRGFIFGSSLDANRCNCPLKQDEYQFQFVGNITKLAGPHTRKAGADVRRAYHLRVPSDAHRSGQLTFAPDRTRGVDGGLGLATFLLGDVTSFGRFVSTSTDARERQWRHFYYAQDTWRMNEQLTLNLGVRLDVINPQTVNDAANGGFLDLDTGEILVAGVGGIGLNGNVKNTFNWAPRLGLTYQVNEKTVLRAGYGRSYDIGVFGSLFGHAVTQNLPVLSNQNINAPNNFDAVFNLSDGPPLPVFPDVPSDGRFPLPDGSAARALREKQRLPTADAWNVTLQYQLTDTLSVEAGYVGNRGSNAFLGDNPAANVNQPSIVGFAQGVPTNLRRPFYAGGVANDQGIGGAYGWTQSIDYFCNCATNLYNSLQAKATKRFGDGYSVFAQYTLQHSENNDGDYFFIDPDVNRGTANFDRTHTFTLSTVVEVPVGRGKMFMTDAPRALDLIVGGWQFNQNTTIQSGFPFNVSYRNAGEDRDTGPNRPDLIGDASGPQTRDEWFNATPIGTADSAFGRPAVGTFGNLERNALRGPGYWRTDASFFKNFDFGTRRLEVRIEAVNIFNHVNLGFPDSEVGVPGTPNPNAGRITSTAFDNGDPQRNFQFGLRFVF
jgi:outer membrane receptor protein involved in Fe transport